MSEPGQDGGEKSHEPTPRKLDEARRQGDIPRSSDLNFAAALLGLALACAGAGAFAVSRAGAALAGWIGDAAASAGPLEIATLRAGFAGLMAEVLVALAPVLGLPVLLVVASVAGQRGFVFAGPKIAPKLSRIDPVAVAKQKFGRAGLFEFAKSALKLIAISLAVGLFLYAGRGPLIGSLQAAPAQIGGLMGRMLLDFLWLSVAISGVIAALDYLFQVSDHRLRQSMTHKELRDEFRQTEGDPHVKQARRQRGHDIATNRMLAEVPKADVVLVNPTHYAVALRWDRAYLADQGPLLPAEEGFVRKIKPLYRLTEFELANYCFLQGIEHHMRGCPFSKGASFSAHKELWEELESHSPGQKLSFYETFLKTGRPVFENLEQQEGASLNPCDVCGSPTSAEVCSVCRIAAQVRGQARQ